MKAGPSTEGGGCLIGYEEDHHRCERGIQASRNIRYPGQQLAETHRFIREICQG